MDSGPFSFKSLEDVSKYILQYNHTWDFVAPVGAVIPFLPWLTEDSLNS